MKKLILIVIVISVSLTVFAGCHGAPDTPPTSPLSPLPPQSPSQPQGSPAATLSPPPSLSPDDNSPGPPEPSDPQSAWLDKLRMQIDPYKDEYLTDFLVNEYAGDYLDLMTADGYDFGRFTGTGRWETFVVFSVDTAFHSAGFDRKIAAVYDRETDEIITQKSFGRDKVDLYLLHCYPEPEGDENLFDRQTNTYILFIGMDIWQGNYSYEIGFYSIENGEWVLLPLPFDYDIYYEDKAVAFACDTLFFFDIEYSGGLPVYTLLNAYAWRNGTFVEIVGKQP